MKFILFHVIFFCIYVGSFYSPSSIYLGEEIYIVFFHICNGVVMPSHHAAREYWKERSSNSGMLIFTFLGSSIECSCA